MDIKIGQRINYDGIDCIVVGLDESEPHPGVPLNRDDISPPYYNLVPVARKAPFTSWIKVVKDILDNHVKNHISLSKNIDTREET